jgi:hypothetical protein
LMCEMHSVGSMKIFINLTYVSLILRIESIRGIRWSISGRRYHDFDECAALKLW